MAVSTNKQRLASSPVVADNRLFVVDTDAVVSAFAADTGAKLWSVPIGSTGKDFEDSLFGGGAAVDGNIVYATSGVGDVAALNAADGSGVWKVKPTGRAEEHTSELQSLMRSSYASFCSKKKKTTTAMQNLKRNTSTQ